MWSDDAHGGGMTSHRALRTAALVLALTGPILSACGGPTDSGAPSLSMEPTPSPTSPILAVADLEELAPKDPDEVIPHLLATSRAAADDLLVRARIVDLVPGASETLAVLDAAAADDLAAPTPARMPETPARMPETSGFRRTTGDQNALRQVAPPTAPLSARGAALGLGTLGSAIDDALDRGAGGDSINGDQTVDFGEPVEGIPAAQLTLVDGSMELRLLGRASEPVDGGEMSVDFDLQGVLDACPSAGGTVTMALSADVRIGAVVGASTAGGRYTMQLDVTASVDDAARLVETVIDVSGSSSDTTTTAGDEGTDIEGWFVEGGSRTTIAGRVADGLTVTDVADVRLTRWSSDVDETAASTFLTQQSSVATMLASMILVGAEEFWRGGACVDVQLVPAGDPTAVQPGEEIPVAIEATSAADGQPIGAPASAIATATGGNVTPSGTPQDLPANVIYAVPGDGSDGEISAEVTSRRGIGTATLAFTTARALVVDGHLDVFRVSGTKCGGLGGSWELALSADFQGYPFTGVLRFDLTSDTGTGTFTLVGSTTGGGITVDQRGTGTVEAVAGPNGYQLIFTGSAWTGGPSAARSVDATVVAGADC